ncbi:MAG: phosphoadenosine phosphosulfate reductase [Paracoccaceae bacterium]|nr:phosphoadenosine phosphosulfate reductase [Paracoccaceae bacterium]
MPEKLHLPDTLSDAEWLDRMDEIGTERGYYSALGKKHVAVFGDNGSRVLLVTFESLAHIRAGAPDGAPLGFEFADPRGWSHLSLIARRETWFRSPHVWRFFDRQIDSGFFEEFDRVVFYGAGMGGYAAAAYSVAAPGAAVIAVAPQATLSPARARWDERFTDKRGKDFTSRYGYAPDMLDAADTAYIVHDPAETEDAMHAALFGGAHVHQILYRRGGAGAIDADLRAMGVLERVFEDAAAGGLAPISFHAALRRRRAHTPWLRAAMARVLAADRPYLTGLFARAALRRQPVPRFAKVLEDAEAALAKSGRRLPSPPKPRVVAGGS